MHCHAEKREVVLHVTGGDAQMTATETARGLKSAIKLERCGVTTGERRHKL